MEQLKSLQTGHIWLIICCIFYLIWWSITFNPMKKFPSLPKFILFFCILISAIVGFVFIIKTLGNLPSVNKTIPNLMIVLAGILLYVLLLYLTAHFLHRQVTTELLLIVGCMVLELCVIASVYGADTINIYTAIIMTILLIVVMAISIICYLAYYNLKPVTAFYDGMIPLTLFALFMAIQVFVIR